MTWLAIGLLACIPAGTWLGVWIGRSWASLPHLRPGQIVEFRSSSGVVGEIHRLRIVTITADFSAGETTATCEADCHEWHQVPFKRLHDPLTCPGTATAALARAEAAEGVVARVRAVARSAFWKWHHDYGGASAHLATVRASELAEILDAPEAADDAAGRERGRQMGSGAVSGDGEGA